jgi:BMFP domain-containing protein YqiC
MPSIYRRKPDPEIKLEWPIIAKFTAGLGTLADQLTFFTVTETRMASPQPLEELAARLARALPPGLKGLRAELEDNFRGVLRANLDRLELVSRERFDVQAELLSRTQARLARMEKRLQLLEQQAAGLAAGDVAGQDRAGSTEGRAV